MSRNDWHGRAAHRRQLEGCIEEERERFGEHPGDVEPQKVIKVTKLPGRGAVIPPRDNPRHRAKHGLEGAYDASCDDTCCTAPPCPRDTDGDGNCGQPFCPVCRPGQPF